MATMIAPTRSNLLKLKDDLAFARLGYELLDQKRSILVVELLTMVDQAVDYQARVDAALSTSHDSLKHTVLQMGRLKVNNVFPAVRTESAVELSERKVMGVHLPRVTTSFIDTGPYFSPEGTTLSVEESLEKFREALSLMGRLAELKVSIMRLAREVKKTIRKVNALEKIVIPNLEEDLRFTKQRIEEAERESFMILKQVKNRLDASKRQ